MRCLDRRQTVMRGGLRIGVERGGNEHIEGHDGVAKILGLIVPFIEDKSDGPVDLRAVRVFFKPERDLSKTIRRVEGEADLECDR